MVVLAGPNGAGKSSLYHQVLAPRLDAAQVPFLNADDYARQRWGRGADARHSYEASEEMARQRAARLEAKQSFVTETVFSHSSKMDLLDEARQRGFTVRLEVVVVPIATSIARVARRVSEGGHDVPVDKIRARHARADSLLAQAVVRVDDARIWHNAGDDRAGEPGAQFNHQLVAAFRRGQLVRRLQRPPPWMPPHLRHVITHGSPPAPGPGGDPD